MCAQMGNIYPEVLRLIHYSVYLLRRGSVWRWLAWLVLVNVYPITLALNHLPGSLSCFSFCLLPHPSLFWVLVRTVPYMAIFWPIGHPYASAQTSWISMVFTPLAHRGSFYGAVTAVWYTITGIIVGMQLGMAELWYGRGATAQLSPAVIEHAVLMNWGIVTLYQLVALLTRRTRGLSLILAAILVYCASLLQASPRDTPAHLLAMKLFPLHGGGAVGLWGVPLILLNGVNYALIVGKDWTTMHHIQIPGNLCQTTTPKITTMTTRMLRFRSV